MASSYADWLRISGTSADIFADAEGRRSAASPVGDLGESEPEAPSAAFSAFSAFSAAFLSAAGSIMSASRATDLAASLALSRKPFFFSAGFEASASASAASDPAPPPCSPRPSCSCSSSWKKARRACWTGLGGGVWRGGERGGVDVSEGHDRDPRGTRRRDGSRDCRSPAAGRDFPSRGIRATDRPPGVERGRVAEPRRQGLETRLDRSVRADERATPGARAARGRVSDRATVVDDDDEDARGERGVRYWPADRLIA